LTRRLIAGRGCERQLALERVAESVANRRVEEALRGGACPRRGAAQRRLSSDTT
jgi:hypothetical protein